MGRNRSNFYLGIILTAILIITVTSRVSARNAALVVPAAPRPATTGIGIFGTWKTGTTTLKIMVGGEIYESAFQKTGFYVYDGQFHVLDRTHISIDPFLRDAPIRGIYEVGYSGDSMQLIGENGDTITLTRPPQTPPGGMGFFN